MHNAVHLTQKQMSVDNKYPLIHWLALDALVTIQFLAKIYD